jgi:hypothetical protein
VSISELKAGTIAEGADGDWLHERMASNVTAKHPVRTAARGAAKSWLFVVTRSFDQWRRF